MEPSANMPAIDSLESLMVWIRERPQNYCQTVGELDCVLWYLHMVWAKFRDREHELVSVRSQMLGDRAGTGLLEDEDRMEGVDQEGQVLGFVTRFWEQVDERLQIAVRTERW
ncbi:MAG: hypothetical protein U0795_26325 [Pirellulales bacterium]